jgi:hypothetical protein
LTENYEKEPPTQAQLNLWADEYGQTFPVVSDADRYIHSYAKKGKGEVKLPSHVLLGPGATLIKAAEDVTEEDVVAALAAMNNP